MAHRLATQWSQLRYVRRSEPEPIRTGASNFDRAQVPWGLDLAAAWAWRLIIIAAAGYGIFWVIAYFSVITLPLVIALLITALVSPAVNAHDPNRTCLAGWPRSSWCSVALPRSPCC